VLNRVKSASLLVLPALFVGVAMTGAPAATATAAATAAPAQLDKVGTTLMETHGMKMRSTTGQRLFANVFVDRFSWHVNNPEDTDVQVNLGKGREDHNWMFQPVTKKDFSFDLHTGKGRLNAGSSVLGRFGRIDLQLTRRAPSTLRTCGAGVAERTTPITVRGTFRFRSHTLGARIPWGAVGSRTTVIRFTGHNDIVTQYGNPANACFNPPQTCADAVGRGWNGPGGARGLLEAGTFRAHGKNHGFFEGFQDHTVRGDDADRLDFDFVPATIPDIETSPAGEAVTVSGKDQPGVRGSAKLASVGAATTRSPKCDGGTVSEQTWKASYTNGPKPLTLTENIGTGFIQKNSRRRADIFITTPGTQPASMRALRPAMAGPRAARQHEIRRTTPAQWRAHN
jgi:hypothetical protein